MPRTLHLHAANPDHLQQAAHLLRSGGLVAFATETVYGLGANALDPAAVARIFAAKQRPAWDPLIVHLASADQLATLTAIPSPLAARIETLTARLWPGPLTLLLPRLALVPHAVTAGRELVGVRVPSHPAALALLAAAGCPVAAPSANTFGHTSPTTAQHVLDDLDGRIDAVLDAGPTSIGLESTVLDPTQTPMMLYRPGAITPEQLTRLTGLAVAVHQPHPSASGQPAADAAPPAALPAPGVGLRHYAPHARLLLIEDPAAHPDPAPDLQASLRRAAQRELAAGHATGVMLPAGWPIDPACTTYPWGDWHDPQTLAARLFDGLRFLDAHRVAVILAPLPPPGGLRDAIRDRLVKAARPA